MMNYNQLTAIVIVGTLCITLGFVVQMITTQNKSYAEHGLQECSYVVPGHNGVVTVWRNDCPTNSVEIQH